MTCQGHKLRVAELFQASLRLQIKTLSQNKTLQNIFADLNFRLACASLSEADRTFWETKGVSQTGEGREASGSLPMLTWTFPGCENVIFLTMISKPSKNNYTNVWVYHTHIHRHTHVSTHMQTHNTHAQGTHKHTHTHIHTHIQTHIHTYTYTHPPTYIHTYTHLHMHTHADT